MTSNVKAKNPAKEAPTEPFKRAVGICLRAIAGRSDIEVGFRRRTSRHRRQQGAATGAGAPVDRARSRDRARTCGFDRAAARL